MLLSNQQTASCSPIEESGLKIFRRRPNFTARRVVTRPNFQRNRRRRAAPSPPIKPIRIHNLGVNNKASGQRTFLKFAIGTSQREYRKPISARLLNELS